jgi:para-aminobenzoate synthetase component 1
MSGAQSVALCLNEVAWPAEPLVVFDALRSEPYPWFLDSSLCGPGLGRFSFLGANPYLVMRAFGQRVELECLRAVRSDLQPGSTVVEHDPFALMRRLMPPLPDGAEQAASLPFVGGAVGYLGYELAQELERLELFARDDLRLPDLALLFVDQLLILDGEGQRAHVAGMGFGESSEVAAGRAKEIAADFARKLEGLSRCAERPSTASPSAPASGAGLRVDANVGALFSEGPGRDAHCFFDEGAYAKAVDSVRNDIADGKLYQANLTHRMDFPCSAEPWRVYLALRRLSPAPFAAYLELPEVAVLSSSPERFLRLDLDGFVETRPIKGTRPRGATSEEDVVLERALSNSAKDRAENLMIVDLMRNDLGRVCEVGSVDVPELWKIERYATLFQLVSTVTGRLCEDRDVIDLLSATFPPGSMTGAPKIAAMRLLASMEPVRRGIYSGALGYLDARGGADLSVVIRTVLIREGRAYVHVGGGIVADSEPVAEYRETLDKARALIAAIRCSSS